MFLTDLKKADQHDIYLINVDGDILKQLIDFWYTGTLTIDTNVQALLEAANLFCITSVVAASSEYIQKRLDVFNCIGFYVFADLYNLTSPLLLKRVDLSAFYRNNYERWIQSDFNRCIEKNIGDEWTEYWYRRACLQCSDVMDLGWRNWTNWSFSKFADVCSVDSTYGKGIRLILFLKKHNTFFSVTDFYLNLEIK